MADMQPSDNGEDEREMFNFRIIDTADGNQIIDRNLKTPYNALTPTQMMEYMEMDSQLSFMDRMERITEIFMYQTEKKQKSKLRWKIIHWALMRTK